MIKLLAFVPALLIFAILFLALANLFEILADLWKASAIIGIVILIILCANIWFI